MSKECIDHYVGVIRGRLKDIEANAENLESQLAKEKSAHDLTCKANVFAHQALEKMEAERDDLRQTVDRLDGALRLASREKDEWEANYEALANTTPQEPEPVTAETIRESEPGSTWENSFGNVREVWDWNGRALIGRRTGRNSGPDFACDQWGPFARSTAAPRGTYPKRLTVEDLDAAEVGSVLSGTNTFPERVKIESGRWEPRFSGPTVLSSDSISLEGRTLTPPEPARRGRVVKPEELREGDVVDLHWTRGGCNLDRWKDRP